MSTLPTATPAAIAPEDKQLRIISHSTLFYWWPVWAVGFLMSALTLAHDYRLAIVPPSTTVREVNDRTFELILKEKPSASLEAAAKAGPDGDAFPLHIAANKNFGILFQVTVLLVIFITSVPLRGLWSVFVILIAISLALIFALAGWWEPIMEALGKIHIHTTLAGFLVPSVVLFLLWVVVVFVFDQRRYMVFTAGQVRVHQDIGDSVQIYDTTGLSFRKRRSDLFRHWVLGMGSGDLVVNTAGPNPQHIEMPNVLFVGRKERQIAEMIKERPVVP